MPITAFVYADDPVRQADLTRRLARIPDLTVVDDVDRATAAIVVADAVDSHTAAVVRAIQRDGCPKVIAVIECVDEDGVAMLVDAGCTGVVRAGAATPSRLRSAIAGVTAGDGTIPADLLAGLVSATHGGRRIETDEKFLSDREVQVLRLAADGLDTAEIARRLCYSERTVKNVIHDVTSRLRLRNRSHAVAYALREGLI